MELLEELKQRVTAQAAKLRRYEERNNQYRQNRLFESNQKRLFEEIEGLEWDENIVPNATESEEFWQGIWGKLCTITRMLNG